MGRYGYKSRGAASVPGTLGNLYLCSRGIVHAGRTCIEYLYRLRSTCQASFKSLQINSRLRCCI